MALGLDGKVASITGARQGIARMFALSFTKEGAAVVIAVIKRQWAEQVSSGATEQGGKALAIHFDVGDRGEGAVQQTLMESAARIRIWLELAEGQPWQTTLRMTHRASGGYEAA